MRVSVRIEMGFPVTVLEASGRLRFWQKDAPAEVWLGPRGERRHDLEGRYIVGEDSRFDLTHTDHAGFSVGDGGQLQVDLSGSQGDVWLEIQELGTARRESV